MTGIETVLYVINHVVTNYGTDPAITKLVDTKALHCKPNNNPGGDSLYLLTAQSSRSTVRPCDDDGDGLLDEDPACLAGGAAGRLFRTPPAMSDSGRYVPQPSGATPSILPIAAVNALGEGKHASQRGRKRGQRHSASVLQEVAMFTNWLVVAFVVGAAVTGLAQPGGELVGKLQPELVPDWLDSSIAMSAADSAALAKLGSMRPASARVWIGEVELGGRKQPIYLIESAPQQLAVLTDLDGDGRLSAKERVPLGSAAKDDDGARLAATIRFATPSAAFRVYPMRVGLAQPPPDESALDGGAARRVYLRASSRALVAGTVMMDGRSVVLRVPVSRKTFTVNVSKGYQYLDCNLDGQIDDAWTSVEMGYAEGAPVVFHVGMGDRYVSIERFDFAKKTVMLALHSASEYERIELQPGRAVPDFEFTALDGSRHRLSDFRGRYLLIDFWGTWCGPCVGDLPAIKKAYEAYKDRGFDILGMDTELPDETPADFETGLAKVKAFVADRGIPWTQARTESIKHLYQRRFMIVSYPTYILLSPDGVILAVNEGLRGKELDQTLRELFKDK